MIDGFRRISGPEVTPDGYPLPPILNHYYEAAISPASFAAIRSGMLQIQQQLEFHRREIGIEVP